MPFSVIIVGKDKRIINANNAALSLMGYDSIQEVAGHICHDTMCPAREGQCPILDLSQSVDKSERHLVNKNGEHIPIMKSVIPIMLGGEEVLLESFVDISDQKRLAEEQQAAFERRGQQVRIVRLVG